MHFYEQKFAYLIFLLYLCLAKVLQNQLLTNKFKIMKKILTLFTALILFGSMMVVQAADYYVAGTMNGWNNTSNDNKMSLVSGNIYSKTFSAMGATTYEFKISTYNWGSDWGSGNMDNTQSNVTLSDEGGNVKFTLSTTSDVTFYFDAGSTTKKIYVQATPVVVPSYTFTSGTTIYYDFTAYGGGINVYAPGSPTDWYESSSEIIPVTLSSNWEITSSTNLFKSAASGWAFVTGTTLPTEGQNMIVSTDGKTYTWGTYVEPTPEYVEVKFFAPRVETNKWDNVYAYSWKGSVTKSAAWPGDPITDTKDAGWYTYSVEKGANVLFHDNAGMQTENITNVQEEACYVPTAINYSSSPKMVTVAQDADCKVEYYIAGTKELIGGASDFDVFLPLGESNEIVFQDVPKGEYAFKLNINSWVWGLGGNDHLSDEPGCGTIAAEVGIGNVGFSIDHTQDITITYYSSTQKICLGAETTKSIASISVDDKSVCAGRVKSINPTYTSDATEVQYEILTGSEFISIADGKISGEAVGMATVRATVPETENYLSASDEFTVEVTALETSNVKFFAPKSSVFTWEHVYAFEWIGDDAQSTWPGIDITTTENNGWYEYDLPLGASLLFNDGAGMQTEDITGVTAATCFVPKSLDKTAHEADNTKPIYVKLDEQCSLNYYLKNKWDADEWTWEKATAAGDGTYRLENVIFGGNGVNYNFMEDNEGASWKEYTQIKYMDGALEKVISVYDTINLVLDPANDTIWAEMVKKEKVVFTIASNSLALCDLGWEPTHPYKYTDMTKQADGTYKWNNGGEEVTLPAGQIELKVVKNRSYANGSWPKDGNFQYDVQRSGEYKIAIHFNPYTEIISIDTILTELVNIQALSIKGSWDNWAEATSFKLGSDNDKSLVTLPLTVGTYTFKLVDGQDQWYGGGESFTRNDITHCGIVAKEAASAIDMTINVDKDGQYLFTYFFETEQLLVMYPANVPDVKIAPLSGKFTINNDGDTAIFARGNLQYNYGANAWYAAEKQYEVLGDLNLRFGDATYKGSIDLFGWSCESSDFGKQWKYKDEEFSGEFKDWGELFDGDAKEWSTLSEAEWNFILNRKKEGKKLWTMIALSSDSLNGLAIFPDDWTAPACASEMVYGFFNVKETASYKKNTFTFEEWAELEAAGAVFFPLAGARAGFWGNTWSGTAESSLSNPLSSGYDWVDNVNWMGYYWLSTSKNTTQAATAILPGWHNNQWIAPAIWSREKRRGQPVRLVTRIPKAEHTVVRENLNPGHYYTICYPNAMRDIQGATLWSFIGKDTHFAYIQQETASTIEAGKPYIMYATASTVQAVLGDETNAPGANGAIHGTFSNLTQDQLNTYATVAGNDLYLVIGDELRRATGAGTGSNTLPAQRAFVVLGDIPAAPAQMPAHVRSMPLHKDATQGFENLEGGEKPIKVLIDGQLYILRGENIYNVNGQIVQ